jgi:hypothetical protein
MDKKDSKEDIVATGEVAETVGALGLTTALKVLDPDSFEDKGLANYWKQCKLLVDLIQSRLEDYQYSWLDEFYDND